MKRLIDAQLPRRFVAWLRDAGHDAMHTLDLPQKNRSSDQDLIERARQDGRIVVSKDDNFVPSFLVRGEPTLLLVSTGNIANADLEALIRTNLPAIEAAFATSRFVEINRNALIVHG